MKLAKRSIALLLVLVMALSAVPGVLAAEDTLTPVAAPSAQEKELAVQVLIAYAKAMFLRGQRAQYDDTQMVPGELGGQETTGYRWQIEKRVAESYTSQFQGYTNCAAFTHDVYYFALGMDIGYWSTAQLIKADEAVRPFYYKVTGKETAEEKAAMEAQFMATLQPADILVYRHSGSSAGHALFHAGNGHIIHSSATSTSHSYSYLNQQERREPTGTIMEMDVSRFFRDESYSRYFFGGNVNEIALVRPLNIWEGTVPQMSIDRMNNLSGIMAEKLSSHTVGQTILPGEELTYTIRMENRNETPVTLAVADELSQYVTLVGDGELKWDVTIEGGKTAEVSYTVKVNADAPEGAAILADKATVGNVIFPCPATYVGKHFTDEQKQAVNKAAQFMGEKSGMELAEQVLAGLDADLSVLENAPVVMDSLFVPSQERPDHYVLNEASAYFAAVAPTMYGGSLVEHCQLYGGVRTRTPYLDQLEVGDIAIATYAPFSTEYVMYLVAGEDAVLRLDKPELFTGEDAQKAVDTLLSYHKFAVLRPAALPGKDAVSGLTPSPASVVPDVAELTGKGETVTLYANDFDSYPVGEDALWQTILAGDELATNVTEKNIETVRYDIVEEDGNRALQLFSAKKKAPWMKVNRELVGNFSVQLDFKMPDKPKHNQYLYMTLYQDSKTHAFIHLHSEGVRFQYKPLKTDQTSNNLNVPPYMLFSEYVTPEVWHTIKIARVDGGLYLKIWDKGQPEPEEWMLSLRNDVLDASQPSYFRMQYYVTGVSNSMKSADIYSDMMVDNLTITRQVELPKTENTGEVYTRGQMMSDLWNMMGSPKVKNAANPFADVKESAEYCDAVLWAYANGITAGTSANTFSPEAPVKRGQAVTFLYRAAKAAASAGENSFTDVTESDYFRASALWAVKNGLMETAGEGKFAAGEDCTRDQIVDALHRMTGYRAAEKSEDAAKDSKLSILMVGNSFCYYYTEELYALLMENLPKGIEEVEIYNLYYSGCTLTKHLDWWQNNADGVYRLLKVDAKGYENLEPKEKWTLEQALAMADWDYISLQGTVKDGSYMNLEKRDSTRIGIAATAEPLLDYFHKRFPQAQLLWNRTWYFEVGRETSSRVYTAEDGVLYNDGIQEVCDYMCNEFDKNKPYDLIQVNSGEAWTKARQLNETANVLPYGGLCARNKVDKFGDKRPNSGDGQHDGDIGGGQLLNAYRWYMTITGDTDLTDSTYVPVYNGVPLDTKLVALLKQAAMEVPV